jgi:hypothetical protein
MANIKSLVLIVAIVGLSAPATSEDLNSADFFSKGCRAFASDESPTTADRAFQARLCAGQLYTLRYMSPHFEGSYEACIPLAVRAQQLAKVTVAYLDNNPSRLHEPFLVVAIDALAHAWPCPSKNSK